VFPQTVVQTCIVHLIRNSLAFVSWKDRKAILPAIKAIYRAENADMAMVRLEEFEAEWGQIVPRLQCAQRSRCWRPGEEVLQRWPVFHITMGHGRLSAEAVDHSTTRVGLRATGRDTL
jgi:hypothetical protein